MDLDVHGCRPKVLKAATNGKLPTAQETVVSLRQRATSGVRWSFASHLGRQALQLATTAILAHLLSPSDYGLLTMALVVTGMIDLFRDLGTSAALVHRKEVPDSLLSSLFWFNTAIGLCSTVLLWLLSPVFSKFYQEPRLELLLRALAPTFFISGLGQVQRTLIEKDLGFGQLAKVEISSSVLASIVAISLALAGAGVWSLVVQSLITTTAAAAMLFLFLSWKPSWEFRWKEVKSLGHYSLQLTGFNLFNFLSRNADYLLVGCFLGARDLGYYTMAYRLMLYPLQNVSQVIGRVIFPVFSQLQEDEARFRRGYLTVAGSIALVSFPMMVGLMVASDIVVPVVFGPEWEPVIPLITILALIGLVQSVGTTVGSIYQAKGRTDLMLRWGLFSGCLTVCAFVIGLRWGTLGVASAYAVVSLALAIPNFTIPFRLINLRLTELGAHLWRPLVCSLVMGGLLLLIRPILNTLTPMTSVLVLAVTGIVVYGMTGWSINREQARQTLAAAGFKFPIIERVQ
jgi:O-antigen/teichoic acid export membrane protein